MKAGNLLVLLWMAAILLMTSGCSTTLVESLPLGARTQCDSAWPGRWHVVEHGVGKAALSEWVQISADCSQFAFTDQDGTKNEKHTLTMISTRAGDFVTFSSPGDQSRTCLGNDKLHCGTELVRYVRSGNEIDLYKPDHRNVHEALESHIVSGYTEVSIGPDTPNATNGTQTAQPPVPMSLIQARTAAQDDKQTPTYHNFIAGDPDQIALILKQHPEFFEQDAYLILRRDAPTNASAQP